jgi:hypothetical protein
MSAECTLRVALIFLILYLSKCCAFHSKFNQKFKAIDHKTSRSYNVEACEKHLNMFTEAFETRELWAIKCEATK